MCPVKNATPQLFTPSESKFFILDYFISAAAKEHSVNLYKSRILVGTSLSIGLLLFFGAIYVAFVSHMHGSYQTLALAIIGPLSLSSLLTALAYKMTARYNACANSIIILCFLSVTFAVFFGGGPLHSPAQYLFTFPVVLSFCLLGKNWGVVWTTITLVTHIFLAVLVSNDFNFPSHVDPATIHEVQFLVYVLMLITTAAVLVIYEGMQSRLKTERDIQEQRFLFLATHDGLTQLPNRVFFYDRANMAIARANREQSSFAVLYMDLDGFKPINDEHGHEAGDHVLKVVAQRLKHILRETDTVARFGGDEFAIIIESLESEKSPHSTADKIALKIVNMMTEPVLYKNKEIRLGASIGTSFYPNDATDIEVLISKADASMYQVKKQAKKIKQP